MSEELLTFNGINGATGDYELPPMTPHDLKAIIAGEESDEGFLNELRLKLSAKWELKEGVSPFVLAESGWGLVMAHDADPKIREALSELLEHRKQQAEERYHEYLGPDGYRPGESKNKFLGRYGVGPGPVDPDQVPYYLLIVGDPETIPYRFQSQLDVQYAVGRIHFDTLDEYSQYAHSVVQAETSRLALPRKSVFWGVKTPGDRSTELSADHMIKPLARKMAADQADWQVKTVVETEATKASLAKLLGGSDTPALLFTASHGLGFPNGHELQLRHQGALLCQDWPGPAKWKQSIPADFYFSADDVADDARLLGAMAFFFACYGAGTPRLDDFAAQAFKKERPEIAPHAFIAGLPKRLLSHPNGGMLALVGHVERAWGYSFMWDRAGDQLTVFESTLKRLMEGAPLGHAIEYFNNRYAQISTILSDMIENVNFGTKVDEAELAGMWTANNDARGFTIIGDPAVRLPVAAPGKIVSEERPVSTVSAATKEKLTRREIASTETTQPPTPPTVAPPVEPPPAAFDMTSFSVQVQSEREGLTKSIQDFTNQLADSLKRAAEDISSLEVITYSTGDLNKVTYNYDDKKLHGELKMRALTRIAFDGDVQVCVPEKDGKVDEELWDVHLSMVKAAQENRAALLATMAELATKLIGMLGGK